MAALTADNDILNQIVKGLGYAGVTDFAREQAKSALLQKIAYYKSRVDFFEQKYGMTFADFCQHFSQIKNHSLTEKEDDSIIWETSLDVIVVYENDYLALNQ